MKPPERRVTRSDGTYGGDGNDAQAAEVLTRGRTLIAEAVRTYGFRARDSFTACRSRSGAVLISRVRLAAPLPAADELAEARLEVLEAKAAALGGPR